MKKILIIPFTMSKGGGAEKVLCILLEELSKYYQIDLIERLECSTLQYTLPTNVHKLKSMSFSDKYLRENNKNRIWGYIHRVLLSIMIFIFPRAVYKYYIKFCNYDYEISFNYLYTSYLIANSPNSSSKKIMWIHSSIEDLNWRTYHGLKKYMIKALFKMQKNAFKKADHIVPIYKNTQRSIEKLFPTVKFKLTLINNGYNFEHITTLSNTPLSIPKNEKYRLISIGRLDKNKNTILQLKVLSLLIQKDFPAELIIVGEGSEKNNLELYIHNNNLSNNVILTGFQNNPYPLLKSSDCLLVSSYAEGFPTVIVEALCLGVPVITTPVGGTEELIQEGGNGYITNYNPETYAQYIEKLLLLPQHKQDIQNSVKHLTAQQWVNCIEKSLFKN